MNPLGDKKMDEGTELDERKSASPPSTEPKEASSDYDPCVNAKITSPFYLYNHDSPRPSFDVNRKSFPQVTLRDLEAGTGTGTGTPNLTPTVTQEKRDAQNDVAGGRLKFWQTPKKQCLTRPKQRGCGWLKQMPKRQRLLVKVLIAMVIIGAMVGIAVGITAAVHGGVYKNNNSTTSLG
ncbi:uncharacterized protein PV06_06089 [Exophiala oligosperma]|uniref:Uncharacterized protein n=1 Tax=Exophiala oligosperma TaxID=215243 RepID=A0A0D2E453_9EURO|nr:uncharacterized protein PV06_06089 [Exophiala oligosperma]KIW42549.1 hypothetical protein PV06_06089 [Exophiala oligosperma]